VISNNNIIINNSHTFKYEDKIPKEFLEYKTKMEISKGITKIKLGTSG